MSRFEATASQQTPTWSNPEHIAYLFEKIRSYRTLSRVNVGLTNIPYSIGTFHDGKRDVTAHEVASAAVQKISLLADSIRDPYLQRGVAGLYSNWERVGDHILTPRSIRTPVDGFWRDIVTCVGASCLASRGADTLIVVDFNQVSLKATPEIMPADLHAEFRASISAMRANHVSQENCA